MKIICLLLYTLLCFQVIAQLKIDAGNDLIVCSEDNDGEHKIGGSPTASGGIEPYSYTWSGKYFGLKYPTGEPSWIYASDILDDTTKSNPIIKDCRNVPDEWTTYYLKVEDAMGKVSFDSIKIIQAIFRVKTIYKLPGAITKGDSIQLFGDIYFLNDFLPLTYTLSPSQGLKDSTDVFGWAKPDTSITYYLQAVNSAGCVSEKIYYWHIDVIDTTINSVQNYEFKNFGLQFYPNPAKNQINFTNPFNTKIKKIELIDFSGRVVHIWKAQGLAEKKLNIQPIPPGIYLLKTETPKEVKTDKIVIQ